MKANYINTIFNAVSEAKAWKSTTLILGCLGLFLAGALVYKSTDQTVILIPHNLATETGRFTINGQKPFQSSPEYIQQIALSDAAVAMNWTPETIDVQYKRLMNRMTEGLYSLENIRLQQQVKEMRSNAVSQSFYVNEVFVNQVTNQVVLNGTVIRWTGDKETIRLKAKLTIEYEIFRGYLHVSKLQLAS